MKPFKPSDITYLQDKTVTSRLLSGGEAQVLSTYCEAAILWNNLINPTGKFEGFAAAHYLFNHLLIRQEIEETIAAIKNEDALEVIDGLLDILWEITPVLELYRPVYVLMHGVGRPIGPAEFIPRHQAVSNLQDFLKWQDNAEKKSFRDLLYLLRKIKYVVEDLLTLMLSEQELIGACTEVITSNFNKFVYFSGARPSNKHFKDAEKKYGADIDLIPLRDLYENPLKFFRLTLSGKVKKPVDWKAPDIGSALTTGGLAHVLEVIKGELK